jgi:hypothetical protein
MSHLHRQLAAQAAIAADKDTCHTCTPVLPKAPRVAPVVQPKAKGKRRGRKA